MQTLFTILTVTFSLATFVSATATVEGFNLRPLCPWFAIPAGICLVVVAVLSRRKAQLPGARSVTIPSNMPSPAEIEATLARVREFLACENSGMPQPDREIRVECGECHVSETYPPGTGNAAAQSAHLLTHPERCLVIGA